MAKTLFRKCFQRPKRKRFSAYKSLNTLKSSVKEINKKYQKEIKEIEEGMN